MSEKHNNINELDSRSRMLYALRMGVNPSAVIPPPNTVAVTFEYVPDESEDSLAGHGGGAEEPATGALQAYETPAYVLPAASKDPATHYLTGCVSLRTQETMRESLERIEKLLGAPPGSITWSRFRLPHVQDVRARLMRQYSKRTTNVTLAALRGVLRSAWELELISSDDYMRAVSVKSVKVDRLPKGRGLSEEEWCKIEDYCRSLGPECRDWPESAYGAFLYVVFALLFGAGLRASEVAGLTMAAYDPRARDIRFIGKGDKERIAPLGDDETSALEQWLSVRAELEIPSSSPLLVRVHVDGSIHESTITLNRRKLERICKEAADKAGVVAFSPHDLRRTFGTEILAGGTDLATTQRLMGHASPETTALYDRRPLELDAVARRKVKLLGRRTPSS